MGKRTRLAQEVLLDLVGKFREFVHVLTRAVISLGFRVRDGPVKALAESL